MTPAGPARHPLAGLVLVVLATGMFAGMDTAIRATGPLVPVLCLLLARYAVQALTMGVWIALRPGLRFRPGHPRFQAVRGLLLLSSSLCAFFGLQHMPVPEFTAVAMLTPVLVMVMAALVLAERVSRLRWLLALGSFAGALIVVRPGSGLFGWAALLPLAGTFALASFQVLTTRMAGLDPPLTTHFWTGFTGAAVLLPVTAVLVPALPDTLAALPVHAWALTLLIALLGSAGHLVLITAQGMAPASALAPFTYAQVGWALVLSWLVFGGWPDAWAFVGMAVIVTCGSAGAWLNLRAARIAREVASVLD